MGDLGNSGSRSELFKSFAGHGDIEDVWVARNPPGFAFVYFKRYRDAQEAVEKLNGRYVCGRRVKVEIATGGKDISEMKSRRESSGYGNPMSGGSVGHSPPRRGGGYRGQGRGGRGGGYSGSWKDNRNMGSQGYGRNQSPPRYGGGSNYRGSNYRGSSFRGRDYYSSRGDRGGGYSSGYNNRGNDDGRSSRYNNFRQQSDRGSRNYNSGQSFNNYHQSSYNRRGGDRPRGRSRSPIHDRHGDYQRNKYQDSSPGRYDKSDSHSRFSRDDHRSSYTSSRVEVGDDRGSHGYEGDGGHFESAGYEEGRNEKSRSPTDFV